MKKILRPENAFWWLTIALILKILFLMLYLRQHSNSWEREMNFWGSCAGDSQSYYLPAENFYRNGIYSCVSGPKGQMIPYAGRMPGLAVVFLFFRMFMSFYHALSALILTQVVVSAAASYALGLICKKIARGNIGFYIGFFLFIFNTFVSLYDFSVMTESLAISFFIIGSYFLINSEGKAVRILLAGIFLGWMFFLRPFTLPIFLWAGAWLIFTVPLKRALLYVIPFLIADGAWITRNYLNEKKIIFAQSDVWAGYDFPASRLALFGWVQTWGGDIVYWNPKAEIGAVYKAKNLAHLPYTYNTVADLPSYAYCHYYNSDSLNDWKAKFLLTEDHPQKYRNTPFEQDLVTRMNRYQAEYIAERPFQYSFGASLRLTKALLFHTGTTNFAPLPFRKLSLRQKVTKIVYSIFYIFFIPLGLILCVGLIFIRLRKGFCAFGLPLSYFMLVNVGMFSLFIFLRFVEYRYLVILYPSGIIGWAYVAGLLFPKKHLTD